MLGSGWYVVSMLAFGCGIVWLVVSAWVGYRLLSQLLPLLGETRNQVQDLGDLAANTVGRASDTMDIVERRVSETMGQATQAGVSVTKQALGFGSALALFYLVSRGIAVLRGQTHQSDRNRSERNKSERNKGERNGHTGRGPLRKKSRI